MSAQEAHFQRWQASEAHRVATHHARLATPALILADGATITGDLSVDHLDASAKYPGHVDLSPALIRLNTPSGVVWAKYTGTYHPKPAPALTPSKAPHVEGNNVVGAGLVAMPGVWPTGTVVQTDLLRDGVVVPGGPYNAWGREYPSVASDAGKTFSARDRATLGGQTAQAPSSNAILMASGAPPVTPPAGGLLLPSGWGITPGALLASSIDPHGDLWDSAGSLVFGYMNNVTSHLENLVLDSAGLHLKSPGAGSGISITSMPPGNKDTKGVPLGYARKGLAFKSVIWRLRLKMAGTGAQGVGWDCPWFQCKSWDWPADGEFDGMECAGGWTGGSGPYGAHEQYAVSGVHKAWDWPGSYPTCTDRVHELVFMRDVAKGEWGCAFDGQSMFTAPVHSTADQIAILTAGQGSTAHAHEMLVAGSEFYGVA